MKRYNQDKLPMLLLDRLAEYAKKTVTGEQLADLFNAFMEENYERLL